jgi:hypothetical protein
MGASNLIPLDRVWAMLDVCLPGFKKRTTEHHHRIFAPDGRIYPSLPLGPHGHRRGSSIEAGHVRNMARFFGIEQCARDHLPEAFS